MNSVPTANALRDSRRRNKRGVDLIPDVLPFGRLWYGGPNAVSNTVDYAKFRSRSHLAMRPRAGQ